MLGINVSEGLKFHTFKKNVKEKIFLQFQIIWLTIKIHKIYVFTIKIKANFTKIMLHYITDLQ